MSKEKREQRSREEVEARKSRMKIAAGAAAIVLAGGGIVGFAVYQNYQDVHSTYCKIGNHEVSKLEYDFFYHAAINNFQNAYGQYAAMLGVDFTKDLSEQKYEGEKTWKQFFQEQAMQLMKEVYLLSDAADEAKFEATDDSYNKFYETVTKYSKEYKVSESDYLKQIYGPSVTKKNIEDILRIYFKASDYADHMQKTDLLPSDEDIEKYYNEHKDNYDKISYRVFTVAADPGALASEKGEPQNEEDVPVEADNVEGRTTEKEESDKVSATEAADSHNHDHEEATEYSVEEWSAAMEKAKNKANEFYEQVYDEETFKELCVKYSETEEAKKLYTEQDLSLNANVSKDSLPSALQSWLMDETREPKATAVIEDPDNHMYFVVYFVGRERVETPTVNVRHILIAPEAVPEPTKDATDEQKEEYKQKVEEAKKKAKEEADKVFETWKSGDKTEESFGKLAAEKSADGAPDGLYENVEVGRMVQPFNDWIFDESRNKGDTGIVETQFGYHIMYFVSKGEPAWKLQIKADLAQQNYSEFVMSRMDKYHFDDVRGELTYLTAITKADDEVPSIDEVNEAAKEKEEAENESFEESKPEEVIEAETKPEKKE